MDDHGGGEGVHRGGSVQSGNSDMTVNLTGNL